MNNIESKDILSLKNYYKYLKNRKSVLLFTELSLCDIVFEKISPVYIRGIRIFKVYDFSELYNYYEDRVQIIYFNDANEIDLVFEYINSKNTENNLPDNEKHYEVAFLIDVFYNNNGVNNNISFEFEKQIPGDYSISEHYYEYIVNCTTSVEYFIYAKNQKNLYSDETILFPGTFGYGDAICSLPVIQYFIDNNEGKIIFKNRRKNTHKIYETFLSNCKCYYIECPKKLMDVIANIEDKIINNKNCYKKIISVTQKFATYFPSGQHILQHWNRALNGDDNFEIVEEVLDNYELNKSLSMNDNILELLKNLKNKYDYIIACQFYTDTHILRCWDEKSIISFVNMCNENNIAVISLSKCPFEINDIFDLSDYLIPELFYVINNCDLHVGIDSCFGHIAGVLNKKNLTIWCQHNPMTLYSGELAVSYRPIRNNFSIYDKNDDAKNLTPEIVFKIAKDILDNKIILKNKFITYKDSENNLNCYFTGQK